MYRQNDKFINFIRKAIENRRIELKAEDQSRVEVKIQTSIFRKELALATSIILAMLPINQVLKKYKKGYKFTKSQEKIILLMCIDYIKRYRQEKKKNETLIQINISSQDKGMEFGIEKGATEAVK